MRIKLKPNLARILISPRESEIRKDSERYLSEEVNKGRWDRVPAIWVTPNFLINGLLNGLLADKWSPTLKPLIVYNGHHRLEASIKNNLPINVYVRYTPGNPEMPNEEKLVEEIW